MIIYTDNTNYFSEPRSKWLCSFFRQFLRTIIIFAKANNILIETKWLGYKANGIPDAFSQSNKKYITNIWPWWQDIFATILPKHIDAILSQDVSLSNIYLRSVYCKTRSLVTEQQLIFPIMISVIVTSIFGQLLQNNYRYWPIYAQ